MSQVYAFASPRCRTCWGEGRIWKSVREADGMWVRGESACGCALERFHKANKGLIIHDEETGRHFWAPQVKP